MARVVTLSPDQSQISTDITNPAADGVAVTTVSVTLKQDRTNDNLEPLPMARYAASNVVVSVTPSTGVTITQPTGTAGEDGAVTATFVSTNPATVSVGATAFDVPVTGTATVVVGGGAPVGEGLFFSDDFAGGVKTNDNGFTWGGTTSRVSVQLAPDSSGDYALRFRFGPNATGSDSSAEQRFSMGQDLSEVWVQYEVWVPTNYVHRNDAPSNNKFLAIWNTVYGSGSGTWQAVYEITRASDSVSRLRQMASTQYRTTVTSNSGTGWSVDLGSGVDFIGGTGPITLGAWHQIRMHFKTSSAGGEADGVMEMWVDGTLFAQATGVFRNFDDVGTPVLRTGYFFGWSNSGFTDETDFYIRGGTNGPKFYNADPGW